jgi:hypothetical protein
MAFISVHKFVAVLTIFGAIATAVPAVSKQANSLRVQHDKSAGTIKIFRSDSDKPILTQHARADFRPYLHPIIAPDGRGVLTQYRPDHHKHQTGLYWGFTNLNGRNYFHHPEADYWRRVSASVLKAAAKNADDQVQWQTVYDLLDQGGRAVLRETQTWTMQEKDGAYVLDLRWKGDAKTDVSIGRYDYGGMFLRMPWRPEIKGQVTNSARQINGQAEGQRAQWVDVGLQVEGRDDLAHIAIFDHPRNSGFPQPWRVDTQMGIGPVRARLGDWKIANGTKAEFQHRVFVYCGVLNHDDLTEQWTTYSEQKESAAHDVLPKTHAEAVERTLKFLAKTQKEDGRWESLPDEPPSLLAVHGKMTMVLTSVAGLAMLAEGSTTTSGTYQKQLTTAKDYLLRLIGNEKDFKLRKYADGVIKTHIANEVPFMIVFLNEVYQHDKDPKLKAALQLVADFISEAQAPNGSWDYTYTNYRHSHTLTVVQNIMALALLKKSGITVADKTIDRALAYIKAREPSLTKTPGYLHYGDGNKGMPVETGITNRAAGTLAMLHYLNRKSDPLWARLVSFHKQSLSRKFIYGGHSPAFQHFMAATASSLLGPESWEKYIETFGPTHLKAQAENGHWPTQYGTTDTAHPHGGVIFETGITCMVLQIPLEHLNFTRSEKIPPKTDSEATK